MKLLFRYTALFCASATLAHEELDLIGRYETGSDVVCIEILESYPGGSATYGQNCSLEYSLSTGSRYDTVWRFEQDNIYIKLNGKEVKFELDPNYSCASINRLGVTKVLKGWGIVFWDQPPICQ